MSWTGSLDLNWVEAKLSVQPVDQKWYADFQLVSTELETEVIEVTEEPTPIYKGFSGGTWVYSVGTEPVGATFISIVGYQ